MVKLENGTLSASVIVRGVVDDHASSKVVKVFTCHSHTQ
jgi:hypothetical protein